MAGIRVVICDAQPMLRRGLAQAFAADSEIVVVAEGAPTLARDVAGLADVLLYDPRDDDDAYSGASEIAAAHPSLAIVFISSSDQPIDLVAMVRASVIGAVSRDADVPEFAAAVRTAASGGSLLDPAVVGRLIREVGTELRAAETPPVLTARELEVLGLVAEGLANREIADRLFISENTVKNHVRSIHEKLDVGSRTEAVAHGVRRGWIRIA